MQMSQTHAGLQLLSTAFRTARGLLWHEEVQLSTTTDVITARLTLVRLRCSKQRTGR